MNCILYNQIDSPLNIRLYNPYSVNLHDTVSLKSLSREITPFYMQLNSEAYTDEADQMITALSNELRSKLGLAKSLIGSRIAALTAIVSDLLLAQSYEPPRPCSRLMQPGSFTGMKVGYRPFLAVKNMLESAGFIQVETGKWFRDSEDGKNKASKITATLSFLDYAARYGITRANWQDHFRQLPRPVSISQPIHLKSSSKCHRGRKIDGHKMTIDWTDPEVIAKAARVNRLNAHFARVDISPDCHFGFRRVFNQGDLEGFDWDKGGRLYSVGGGYQMQPAKDRASIRISGEPTVEIDIGGSHIRILHALKGQALDPNVDPYGKLRLPRHIVKTWVTMTMGYKGFQRAWSKEIKEKYRAEWGGDLQADHPIATTRNLILDHLPLLTTWPESDIRWGDLQFIEGEIILDCVERLAFNDNIPALPVYDSIIVPISGQRRAMAVLAECFEKRVGAKPMLKVKQATF